jgi:hypothetical protein
MASWANPNEVDATGKTAIFEAAAGAYTEIVGRLLLCKAEMHVPLHNAEGSASVLDVVKHEPTRALMLRWSGSMASDAQLNIGLLGCHSGDRARLAQKLGVPEPQESSKRSLYDNEQLQEGKTWSAAVQDMIEKEAATAVVGSPPNSVAEVQPLDDSSSNTTALEELELDERGVPKRMVNATRYCVVHKMVAVRRYPNPDAAQIRAYKHGDKVDMFEWDHTRRYRRIVTETQLIDSGPLEKVDGWMLIYSEKFGTLLEKIVDVQEREVSE